MNLDRITEKLRDVKLPILLLCAGLLMVLIGGHGNNNQSDTVDSGPVLSSDSLIAAEERLTSILQKIDGVGEVHVLLSYETTAETEYVSDDGETVRLSSGSGTETALAKFMRYPHFQGAVVVCRGASQASVKLSVIEAIAKFTGLRSDQISVLQLRT